LGTFVITDKIEQPPWWRPDGKMIPFGDKENVLGTRWMSLQATGTTAAVRGYGLHGTWEPETIGKQASAGCVRLKNNEVEELFLMIPTGTSVAITE
jgi:lipoprotein-anchoring transpeptidase ErfK/SrfK